MTDPEWTDADRALVLALLAEQRETCPSCGHPMSVCRDPRTAGQWTVVESVCQAGLMLQVHTDNAAEKKLKKRGVHLGTRLNGGAHG